MGGHGNAEGFVMMRPDGTPMSREEVIVHRRGAFKWLPVLCSNDLVHGSWWFVWGSLFTAAFAVYPLIQKHVHFYDKTDDFLPNTDFDVTWALVIVSGVFFTLGSLAFVRAFEEPPQEPLLKQYKHFQTDELLGAWLFLFGTMPGVPYMFVFFTIEPSAFYFMGFIAAIIFSIANYFFVIACYPTDVIKKQENYLLPLLIRLSGAQMWAVKHLANDWLAGCWMFLWANMIITAGSFLLLLVALGIAEPQQIFIWFSGSLCSFLFLVGSLYFVAGSYPHAQQFYYSASRPHNIPVPSQNDRDDEVFEPVAGDALRLLPATRRSDEPALSTANLHAHNKKSNEIKKGQHDEEHGGFEMVNKADILQGEKKNLLGEPTSQPGSKKIALVAPLKKTKINSKFASPPPPAIITTSTKNPLFQKLASPTPAISTNTSTVTAIFADDSQTQTNDDEDV